jgi:hypothetical protein
VSVGHIARLAEAAGIATVVVGIAAFRDRLTAMRLPRLVTTPHLMGQPLGRPGDAAGQRAVILAALALLASAEEPGAVVDLA